MTNEDKLSMMAFNIASNKGRYALLLGSGVSRAAEIPTGYEIHLDLIRKLAGSYNEIIDVNKEESWYYNKFNETSNYSALINKLGKTSEERQSMLAPYFEPSAQDKEEGKKMPTHAHKAIASLVSKGCIKVIVTTNFDRLLENSLKDEGIEPVIISSESGLAGLIPLVHLQDRECLILKVNGDYKDSRILNTTEELSRCNVKLKKLLNQIFDEYGLIIAGWSGVWDDALRNILIRCKNHRYSTYWLSIDVAGIEEKTAQLITQRKAETIEMDSANKFFTQILEKVKSIESCQSTSILSDKILIETVKRYIPDDQYHIQLSDLIFEETETAFKAIYEDINSPICTQEMLNKASISLDQIKPLEKKLDRLSTTLLLVCFYGKETTHELVENAIKRISAPPSCGQHITRRWSFRLYPVLHLLYVCGLGYIVKKNYRAFLQLMSIEALPDINSPAETLFKLAVIERFSGSLNNTSTVFSVSKNLEEFLFDQYFFKLKLISNRERFNHDFDYFEYLNSLLYVDATYVEDVDTRVVRWVPCGQFCNRERRLTANLSSHLKDKISNESASILAAKLFNGSSDNLKKAKEIVDVNIRSAW